jgi:hypothetical protein
MTQSDANLSPLAVNRLIPQRWVTKRWLPVRSTLQFNIILVYFRCAL